MKKPVFLLIACFTILPIFAQDNVEAAIASTSPKCKDLVVQLNVIFLFGNQYGKTHIMSAAEYGNYVAQHFIDQGFIKDFCYDDLRNACLYNYSCHLPASDYEVIDNEIETKLHDDEKYFLGSENSFGEPMIEYMEIKCCKPSGFIKFSDPVLIISCQEFMDYFNGAMQTIASHIGCNFNHWQEDDMAYTTITKYY